MRGKRKITALLLGLVLLLAASSVSAGPAWVEHEAITVFRPEAAATEADMDRILAASLGGGYELISPMRVDDSLVLGLVRCEKYTADELAALLAGNPDIVRAEKNGIPVPHCGRAWRWWGWSSFASCRGRGGKGAGAEARSCQVRPEMRINR